MGIIKRNITKRIYDIAEYVINTKGTIRETSTKFNISKSTVHKDLHDRLYKIDKQLWGKIQFIMKEHIAVRHIRGGESTRKKYISLNSH